MFRRNFIQRLTLAGTGSFAALGAVEGRGIKRVTYRVSGFTCVTCAIGLDTVLGKQEGVVHVKSSYPDAKTVIDYDPGLVTENALEAAIAEMGFRAARDTNDAAR
jgi:copper chaperone